MIIFFAIVAAFAVLGGVIVFLTWRLTKTKEDVVAARLSASRSLARQQAATQEARKTEKQCLLLLGQVETQMAQTGQALEVAGNIKLVSQQIQGLINRIATPMEALMLPQDYKRGRHALPAAPGQQDITTTHDELPEFTS